MPKTKNAFAFRDFDAEKILQRPYFREFLEEYHIEDKTDEEILNSLSFADNDSAKDIRRKAFCLFSLRNLVEDYIKRIAQHSGKLAKYSFQVGNRIINDETADIKILRERHKRLTDLIDKYEGALVQWSEEPAKCYGIKMLLINNLLKRIIEQLKELDEAQSHNQIIFAARLKKKREEMELTRAELATRLNTTKRAVGYYETAMREPNLSMLAKISKELNCTVDWLIGAKL